MDEQLAAIYGTGQVEEDDLEKTAAAELLVKLAEEQGVDLNDFSDAEVGEMLDDLYNNGIEHTAENEKVAEADYLGRVMAHSMVQELNNIEKSAGEYTNLAMKAIKKYPSKLKERGSSAAAFLRQARQGASTSGQKLTKSQRAMSALRGMGKLSPELRVVGTGGAVAGAHALGKRKESSALETLATQRAYELAAEAGYIKEASGLDYAVERRALEICEANGIPVEWNE